MSIVRFEPWSLAARAGRDYHQTWAPAVDVFEQKDRFVVRADVPGVDPADIEVSMDNGVLGITGERHAEDHSNIDGVSRFERVSGRFQRRFTLPDTADADAIKAKSANGILEISIPKLAVVQPRRITIEAA